MIQPLSSYYYAERLLAAPESETLFIPGADEDLTYDLLILAVGPGKDGSQMQAASGDRVIVEPKDFWEYNSSLGWKEMPIDDCAEGPARCCFCGADISRRGFYNRRWMVPPGTDCRSGYEIVHRGMHACRVDCASNRGFVSDTDLVAAIPGPDHEEIYPCNDYVLIEPDRLYKQDAGNIVQERPSGLLVASHTLVGGGERAKQEGWQAYIESQRLWDSPEWQQEPDYYRHKRLHAYLNDLPDDVRRECRRFAESEEAPRQKIGWVQRETPTRGRIVDPGYIGRRPLLERGGRGLDCVMVGDLVHWPASHQCLVLQVGERQLLALKAEYLDAVEVE